MQDLLAGTSPGAVLPPNAVVATGARRLSGRFPAGRCCRCSFRPLQHIHRQGGYLFGQPTNLGATPITGTYSRSPPSPASSSRADSSHLRPPFWVPSTSTCSPLSDPLFSTLVAVCRASWPESDSGALPALRHALGLASGSFGWLVGHSRGLFNRPEPYIRQPGPSWSTVSAPFLTGF